MSGEKKEALLIFVSGLFPFLPTGTIKNVLNLILLFAEGVEQDQPAHTCSLILFCTLHINFIPSKVTIQCIHLKLFKCDDDSVLDSSYTEQATCSNCIYGWTFLRLFDDWIDRQINERIDRRSVQSVKRRFNRLKFVSCVWRNRCCLDPLLNSNKIRNKVNV